MRALLVAITAVVCTPLFAAEPLLIYTERKPVLIEPLLAEYTKKTGQAVQLFTDQAPVLIERLRAEGTQTKADILMTVDAGSLWQAAERDVFVPVNSTVLTANIPSYLRDSKNRWFGLSQRARTVIYNPAMVDAKTINTYADLAKPAFKGKLCLRSSKKIYNQSLTAMLIARSNEITVEATVRGWVQNLAQPPFADDTLLVQAIASGQCAVGIANTYYFARLKKDDPALKAQILFVEQDQAGKPGAGMHVNISGAGIVKHTTQAKAAQALLEWLSGADAQAMFANANLEYPVNAKAKLDPVVASWGSYKADPRPVEAAGKLQVQAVKLMDRAGWK
jgi:iron(III) transport system substrate-binding protein